MLSVTGVVLAGGKATRMGNIDKGQVLYCGLPMVEHVLKRFMGLDGCIVNLNTPAPQAYKQLNCTIIHDEEHPEIESHAGPLLGILSGLNASKTPWVLFSPCDTPDLPVDYVSRMLEAVQKNMCMAAVAYDGERVQPLHLLLNKNLNDSLLMYLLSGQRKTFGWLNQIKPFEVDFSDAHEGFTNINYLAQIAE